MHFTVQAYLYVCMKAYWFRINLYQPTFQTPEGNQYYFECYSFHEGSIWKNKKKKTPHCPELRLSVKILENWKILVIVSDS